MKRILYLTECENVPLFRQSPGGQGLWADCQFYLNEARGGDYGAFDYCIVHDNLYKKYNIKCNKNNIILITGEPPSIKSYSKEYLKQFKAVITCHRGLNHQNVIYNQQALPWHILKSYDELKSIRGFKKTKLLSVITSDKCFTPGHRQRLLFVKQLSEMLGDKIDVFGRGINEINDKWDAIADYKYHIVIENSAYPDYWTEKLADAYLAGSYPIYYGAPNICDYFSQQSLAIFDINDIQNACKIINNTIANDCYTRFISDITISREHILDKYNVFPFVADLINILEKKSILINREIINLVPQRKRSSLLKRILRKAFAVLLVILSGWKNK